MSNQPSFNVLGINHLGLAPADPEKAHWFLVTILGLTHLGKEYVQEQKTHTSFISSAFANQPGCETRLEILRPDSDPNGPIASYLQKRGGGIHHVAIAVDRIDAVIAHLVAHGVRMIDAAARPGAHKTRIAFVHPSSTGGLLVELVEQAHP